VAGRRHAAGLVVAASVAGFALRTALKLAVARPRPSDDLVHVIERADGSSFPSGHVMFYTVLLGALWLAMATSGASRSTRRAIAGATVLALLLIGLSRIYLGAHWLSDVAAGYVFGAVVVGVAMWTRRWWSAAHPE
jgi:undecaprenyl-diphosphatase